MSGKCKGSIYRYRENSFLNRKGEIVWTKRVRLLKNVSCISGCDAKHCFNFLPNEMKNYQSDIDMLPSLPENIEDGDKLKLSASWDEEGIDEMWFIKVD